MITVPVRARLTLEAAIERLQGSGIELVEYSGTSRDHSIFRCVKDGYEWESSMSRVPKYQRCPRCRGRAEHGDLRVLESLKSRDIDLIVYGGNIRYGKSTFQCRVDGHIWQTSADSVMRGSGCPKCSGNLPVSSDDIVN